MKFSKLSLVLFVAAVFAMSVSTFAQTETFSDPNVDYTFEMADTTWKIVARPSDLSPNVEYVYGSRSDGSFEVRKVTMKAGQSLTDIIRAEEDGLQFRKGFVPGKEEGFEGFFKGRIFNFEILKSSRNWSGRYYFLPVGDNTVYVLRFEAPRDQLRSILNVVNRIARTFNLVKER